MPTGLTDTVDVIGDKNVPPGSAVHQTSPAVNLSFRVIFLADGVPQPCQGYHVPAQATVRIRAHNGADTGNSAPCRVALYRDALGPGLGDVLTPDTEIIYPVDNTGNIWGSGTAGDGLSISVRANAIG